MRPVRSLALVAVLVGLLSMNCGRPFAERDERDVCVNPLAQLREQLQGLFADPVFSNAFWGVLVQSAETGEIVLQHNADKSFIPASNMKLFTTAVALLKLGPDYRYHTRLYGLGGVDAEGTLQGHLVIEGSGDPTISGRFQDGRITATFEAWAESLALRGVRAIAGDIIGDDRIFDQQLLGPGWSWDYESDWYAAQISGLSFNDNCVDIKILPGEKVGVPARVQLDPTTSYITLNSTLTTCRHPWEADWHLHRHQGTNAVDLTGSIGLEDEGYVGWFTVHNPTLFAVTVFREVLISRGIRVLGQARDIDQVDQESVLHYQESWPPLTVYESPPLTEIIKVVNKRSQNYYAEQLLKTLGAIYRGQGGFSDGVQVVSETLSHMGVPPSHFIMVDGSGLSRHNLLTARQVLTLLSYMARHRYFPYFLDSLPIGGIDGTISMRMRGTPAQGKVWAKTGYVNRVRALSGYARSLDGELFIFSMLVNNYTVPTSLAENIQDRACQLLASFSRRGFAYQRRES